MKAKSRSEAKEEKESAKSVVKKVITSKDVCFTHDARRELASIYGTTEDEAASLMRYFAATGCIRRVRGSKTGASSTVYWCEDEETEDSWKRVVKVVKAKKGQVKGSKPAWWGPWPQVMV